MGKPEVDEKGLENFITLLSESIMKKEGINPLEIWSKEQLESKPEHLRAETLFWLEISIGAYLEERNLSPVRLKWDMLEGFLNGIFKKFEGFPCCADKSRYILNNFIYSKEMGEEFKLEEKREDEYWKPLFLDVDVWEAIIMYYIRPEYDFDKYILALGQLMQFYSDIEKNKEKINGSN